MAHETNSGHYTGLPDILSLVNRGRYPLDNANVVAVVAAVISAVALYWIAISLAQRQFAAIATVAAFALIPVFGVFCPRRLC